MFKNLTHFIFNFLDNTALFVSCLKIKFDIYKWRPHMTLPKSEYYQVFNNLFSILNENVTHDTVYI